MMDTGTRAWWMRLAMAGVASLAVVSGCAGDRERSPLATGEEARASGGAEPDPEDRGELMGEEAGAETPPRKGERIAGGLPPIRRADLISGLTVPGGQRFLLGGGQPSSFFCDVENRGETQVLISATRGVGATVVARLGPGDSASHRFQPTEAAVIANLDPLQAATIRVRVWGDTNLGMKYEPEQR